MDKYIVIIKISGKFSTKKHAKKLSSFIVESFSNLEEAVVKVETIISEDHNFNISIEGNEIFSKTNFWNRYPDYQNIVNKIAEKLNEKSMYKAMKAAYDFNNELF